jgi:putative NIF3 family GTP cyclohydrolase 1 type 2
MGHGTFRPLEGANPQVGAIGRREEVDEWRLEVIVPEAQSDAVVRAMIAAHPYEEVAYDVCSLKNAIHPYGSARMGQLDEAIKLEDFVAFVGAQLRAPNVRVAPSGKSEVRRVACVPGSGASYIDAAVRAKCDCLVTGDIKHHDALKAQAMGVALIDATHTATERAAVPMLRDALQTMEGVSVEVCELDTNPFL